MVKKITEQEFQKEIEKGVVVVDFSAEWCGPCKMLAPIMEELSEELEGKVKFLNVDVDEEQGLAMKFGIASIPALLVLKDGTNQDMLIGFRPKDALAKELQKYI